MKNFIVRLSVITLAATGFAASSVATKSATAYDVKSVTVATSTPAAMCPPDGSKGYCGMH